MSATISEFSPGKALEVMAGRAGASPIYQTLLALSLTPSEPKFVGGLVAFIATRERTGILAQWTDDCPIANELERLGRAAWGMPELTGQLALVDPSQRSKDALRGFNVSHPLVVIDLARESRIPC